MEVRETQSYIAVVKYTGQPRMDGAVHWEKLNTRFQGRVKIVIMSGRCVISHVNVHS